MALDLAAFRSALASLRKAVTRSQAEPADDEVRDSVIQRFEYTYELAWKTLKRQIPTNFDPPLPGRRGRSPIGRRCRGH